MKVAAVNFKLRKLRHPEEFDHHVEDLVKAAANGGAELVVFPELIVLELLHLAPHIAQDHIPNFLAGFANSYEDLLIELADKHAIAIVGGSYVDRERRNVCPIVARSGALTRQYKNVLTRWEADEWKLVPELGVSSTFDARLGVLICYDCEFPEAGRSFAEAGGLLLCVPSFTETRYGFHRVRWSCRARAIENQVFVVHAALVGDLGREPVPQTYGSSAILTPACLPFPENGVLDETKTGEEGLAIAHADFNALQTCRETGDVRNWNDRGASSWIHDEARKKR